MEKDVTTDGEEEKKGAGDIMDLWRHVIVRAQQDLKSVHSKIAVAAAAFFFCQADDSDIQTFAGLCRVNGTDADRAARAIFAGLPVAHQKRVKRLLKNAGYGKEG